MRSSYPRSWPEGVTAEAVEPHCATSRQLLPWDCFRGARHPTGTGADDGPDRRNSRSRFPDNVSLGSCRGDADPKGDVLPPGLEDHRGGSEPM